jgi:retron-type reverse transcriptase
VLFSQVSSAERLGECLKQFRIYAPRERLATDLIDVRQKTLPDQIRVFQPGNHGNQLWLQKSAGGGRLRGVASLCIHTYENIISVDNLLGAWREFVRGKRKKKDVQEFQYELMANIFDLHRELANHTYMHGPYRAFSISDPKPRNIHKASVRDRLLHHALYRKLYPFFDRTFIADSYSCRNGKGTHRAMNRFRSFACKVSRNHTHTVWVLKCDIRKFFASIDQDILMRILASRIHDERILWLIGRVVASFYSTSPGVGLPLGNLTSQLLVNIYMNELDQYLKHGLKEKHYIRYADDFVILSRDRTYLEALIPQIQAFLADHLRLELHPKKVSIGTFASGVDFLGWVHFPDHRVLRTSTKRRALRNCAGRDPDDPVVRSYAGLLTHGNAKKLKAVIVPS